MIKIVDKYIFKELLIPFIISLIFFSFIFLLSRILDIADMIVNYNIPLVSVGKLILYSISFFLQYTIPMSVMMAVLTALIDMNGSNEVLALKSGGVGVLRILYPVLTFCILGTVLTAFMTFYGLPWGKFSFKKEVYTIAQNNMSVAFKEKTFIDSFEGFAFFINKIDNQTNSIKDVFIEDRKSGSSPVTITAPKGRIVKADQGYMIELEKGCIIQIDKKDKSIHKTYYDKYSFMLNLSDKFSSGDINKKDDDEMYFNELNSFIKNYNKKDSKYYSALIKRHEKFSLPCACIFLGLIAFSIGLKNKTGKKSSGIVYGLVLFVFYYILLALGWSLGESDPKIYPPFAAMWIPNIIMFLIGSLLLYLSIKEKSIHINFFKRL